jgi:phosphatidylserine/phosphatidylglycerophosphate/cardiolipin synthase-like enzyme
MGFGDGHDLTSPRFAGDDVLEACFDGEHRMVVGEAGECVSRVQQALVDLGYPLPTHGVDGHYGDETAGAVAKFKNQRGIAPSDGVVGPKTMHELDESFPAGLAPVPLDTLRTRWFLEITHGGDEFPPRHRYPSSTTQPWTDGNLVAAILEGSAVMKIWHDTLQRLAGNRGGELYHANWHTNPVRVLGQSQASSDAVLVMIDCFKHTVIPHLLLSDHLPHSRWNGTTIAALQRAGVTTAVLDPRYPAVGGINSNHQKFYVLKSPTLNEFTALVGSVDINTSRWDRAEHLTVDPERGTEHSGYPYGSDTAGPTHEIAVLVNGPAVADLEQSFRDRWHDPTLAQHQPPPIVAAKSPAGPAAGPHSVQVLHTYGRSTSPPGYTWSPTGEFTIWAAYLKAIQTARRYIYIEDQYFLPFGSPPHFKGPPGPRRDSDITYQLGEAIRRGVRVMAVLPDKIEDAVIGGIVLDQRQLGLHYLAQLAVAGPGEFVTACLHNGTASVYVHAKLLICDDEYVNLGSANITQRSMTHDSELNVAIVDAEGRFARQLRKSIWSHYLGSAAGLDDFDNAYPKFKAAVTAGRGLLRPLAIDPPTPGTAHETKMGQIDPYAGP